MFLFFLLFVFPIICVIAFVFEEKMKKDKVLQEKNQKQMQIDKTISEKNEKFKLKIPEYKMLAKSEINNNETLQYVLNEFHGIFGYSIENFIFSDSNFYDAFLRVLLCAGLIDVDFSKGKLISGKTDNSKSLSFNLTSYQEFKRIIDLKYSSIKDTDILIYCLFNECLIENLSKNCMFYKNEIDVSVFKDYPIEDIVRSYFELYNPTNNINTAYINAYLLQSGLYNDIHYIIDTVNISVEKIQTEQKINKLSGVVNVLSPLTQKIKEEKETSNIFAEKATKPITNTVKPKQISVSKYETSTKSQNIAELIGALNKLIEYKSSKHYDSYIEQYKYLREEFYNTDAYNNKKMLYNAKVLYESNRVFSDELQQAIENFMLLKPTYWFDNISNYIIIKKHLLNKTRSFFKFNVSDEKINERPTSDIIKDFEQLRLIFEKRYNINKDISNEVFIIVINRAVVSYYTKKWLKLCGGMSLGKQSIKEYTEQCLNRNVLNKADDEVITAFYYYIANALNGKLHIVYPTQKMVDDINSYINTYQKDKQDETFESLLFKNIAPKTESAITIDDIDLMTGLEFEEFIAKLFIKMGYSANTTKGSGDQGVDVIAEKHGVKYGIQCKCYANAVGNSAIQEVVAGKQFYNLDKLLVITNNCFTKSAQQLARANKVILWDRTILKEKIENYSIDINK